MNRVVVLRAAAGLAAYLRAHGASAGDSVVIGYDARHNSDVFARDTAEVMTGAGFAAYVLPRPLPTPLLAFAIRDLGCVAGVMVTASHNPPQDNGYKVYLGDGSQIVPPADEEIAEQIAAVGPAHRHPPWQRRRGARRRHPRPLPQQRGRPRRRRTARPRASSTRPLHGVGGATVVTALERAGFPAPHVADRPGRARPRLPDRVVPQPRGAGGDGPGHGAGRGGRRRHRRGQRSRRGSLCRRGTRPARVADAARRRGRRAARPAPARPSARRGLRDHDRVLVAARQDGGRGEAAVRRDAHRIQVARPRRGPRLRLRGSTRLLRRPRPREGQGRRLRAADGLRHRRTRQGGRPYAARPARRPRPHLRAARHRPALGADGRPRRHPGRHRPAARPPPVLARGTRGRAGRRPLARVRPPFPRRSGCASGWPTTAASSYDHRGPSRSSSATSRW